MRGDRRRRPPRDLEHRGAGPSTTPRSTRPPPRSPRSSPAAGGRLRSVRRRAEMATLTYMPTEHVPVLASELIDLLDPHPGETAVDCTFGGGGHARLVAERLGPGGTLVCIDRDPAAERALRTSSTDELELRDAVRARRLRRRPRRARRARACAPTSSTWTSASPRCSSTPRSAGFSYTYDAPLDMRMDPEQELSAADVVNEWPRGAARRRSLREYGEERHARSIAARDRAPPPARDHGGAGRGDPRGGAARLPLRPRPSREADLPGDPDRRQRRARLARPGAPGGLGPAARPAAAWRRSRSTRSRTAASSASSPTAPAAASARPSCRSACAAASRRRSCSPGGRSPRPPRRSSATRARTRRACARARKLTRGAAADDERNGA